MYEGGRLLRRPVGADSGFAMKIGYWTRIPVPYNRAQRQGIRDWLIGEHREYDVRVRRIGLFRNKGVVIHTAHLKPKEVYRFFLTTMDEDERVEMEMEDLIPELDRLLAKH